MKLPYDPVILLLGMYLEKTNSKRYMDFPGGPAVKNLPASAGDTGSIPGLGRFRGAIKPVCHNY